MKWIRYENASPFVLKIKTHFDEDFHSITILPPRGHWVVTVASMEECIKPLYQQKKNISALKLKYFKNICNSESVSDDLSAFFTSLLSDESIDDETVLSDINDFEEENFFFTITLIFYLIVLLFLIFSFFVSPSF